MKLIEILLFLKKRYPMSTTYLSKKQLFIIAFMLIAVLFRLLPHLPNFTPITAIALFGGLYFSNKTMAYLVPLVIMALSDLFLGFHSISFVVYAAFIVVSFIGTQTKKPSVFTILLSSISFFIITNFGVWLIGYPKTWTGLLSFLKIRQLRRQQQKFPQWKVSSNSLIKIIFNRYDQKRFIFKST